MAVWMKRKRCSSEIRSLFPFIPAHAGHSVVCMRQPRPFQCSKPLLQQLQNRLASVVNT